MEKDKCQNKECLSNIENEVYNALQVDKNFFNKQEFDRLKLEIKRVKNLCDIHIGCITRLNEALANIVEILNE